MTEHPRSDDELLSSHLDGELTAEETARLEERLTAASALHDRLAAMRAARDLTGSPVESLAPTDLDRMITTALAASHTAPNVTDLATAGSRHRGWPSRLAVAAAAVVALALTVPALLAIDRGNDNDTAGVADSAETSFDGTVDDDRDETAADMATEAAALEADPSAAGDDAADGAMPAADTDSTMDDTADTQDTGLGQDRTYDPASRTLFADNAGFDPLLDDLGDFDTTTALSTAVSEDWAAYRSTLVPSATTTSVAPPDDGSDFVDPELFLAEAYRRFDALTTTPCATVVDAILDYFGGELVLAADYASASVDGAPVTVGVFLRPDDRAELLVIDQATCDVRKAPLG